MWDETIAKFCLSVKLDFLSKITYIEQKFDFLCFKDILIDSLTSKIARFLAPKSAENLDFAS